MTVQLVTNEGDCRVCGDPAWSADNQGHVHLCCASLGLKPCPACETSKALNRKRRSPRPESHAE